MISTTTGYFYSSIGYDQIRGETLMLDNLFSNFYICVRGKIDLIILFFTGNMSLIHG